VDLAQVQPSTCFVGYLPPCVAILDQPIEFCRVLVGEGVPHGRNSIEESLGAVRNVMPLVPVLQYRRKFLHGYLVIEAEAPDSDLPHRWSKGTKCHLVGELDPQGTMVGTSALVEGEVAAGFDGNAGRPPDAVNCLSSLVGLGVLATYSLRDFVLDCSMVSRRFARVALWASLSAALGNTVGVSAFCRSPRVERNTRNVGVVRHSSSLMAGGGLGEYTVSLTKPLGIILEERDAGKPGVQVDSLCRRRRR